MSPVNIRNMKVKKMFFLLVFSFFLITILIVKVKFGSLHEIDRKLQLHKIAAMIYTGSNTLACKQPNLPVFAPELMKFVHDEPPIDCSAAGIDWVKCEDNECNIQDAVKDQFGPIQCSFTDLIRVNDYESIEGETTYSDSFYKLEASDVVKVSCKTLLTSVLNLNWSATLTGICADRKAWERSSWAFLPDSAAKMNVLMFGLDSISRNTFIRKLPKSYNYLTTVLGAHVLESYNIVGDGTPQALIPILTGKTELELPDTRKRFANTKFVNSYPFIWDDYRRAGYVTAFFEDVPELSTFTYRLNGFNETPTDHYMRPYYLASLSERNKWPKLCTGDTPRHNIMLNQIKNFFTVYASKPKFLFGFHGELSHDSYNLVGVADQDLLDFFKYLHKSDILYDTILIIMADHGHRFAEIRNTIQGKQEERLPFFSFTLPELFKERFPQAYFNFQRNLDKLTTPFDIHETLLHLLDLSNVGAANIKNRAVSLFTKIPSERSCAHAYIEPHWCTCLEWQQLDVDTVLAVKVADSLTNAINNITEPHRDICQKLRLAQIHWLMKINPNENLVKFHKNADFDGFVADLSSKMTLKTALYQIKATLEPGKAVFEASIQHLIEQDQFIVKTSDISRVNMYGNQAWCVLQDLPDLRKFCHC